VLDADTFRDCAIVGSINLPFKQLETLSKDLAKDQEIIVYCASYECEASRHAYRLLTKLGFTHIKAYEGGIAEWYQKGYPTQGSCALEFLTHKTTRSAQRDATIDEITAEELRNKL